MVFELGGRTESVAEEAAKITFAALTSALNDIGGDRHGRANKLATE